MQFTITFVGGNNAFLLASKRASSFLDVLKQDLATVELANKKYEAINFLILEQSLGRRHGLSFYEEKNRKSSPVAVAVGVDPNLTFVPAEDARFFQFIVGRVIFFAAKSGLMDEDASKIVNICEKILLELDSPNDSL